MHEYANMGSQTFAPICRTGGVELENARHCTSIQPNQLKSYEGICDLEANLPRAVTTTRIRTRSTRRQHVCM